MRHDARGFDDRENRAAEVPPDALDLTALRDAPAPGLTPGAIRGIIIGAPIALLLWALIFLVIWLLL